MTCLAADTCTHRVPIFAISTHIHLTFMLENYTTQGHASTNANIIVCLGTYDHAEYEFTHMAFSQYTVCFK